jgi:hypothetical protein
MSPNAGSLRRLHTHKVDIIRGMFESARLEAQPQIGGADGQTCRLVDGHIKAETL